MINGGSARDNLLSSLGDAPVAVIRGETGETTRQFNPPGAKNAPVDQRGLTHENSFDGSSQHTEEESEETIKEILEA